MPAYSRCVFQFLFTAHPGVGPILSAAISKGARRLADVLCEAPPPALLSHSLGVHSWRAAAVEVGANEQESEESARRLPLAWGLRPRSPVWKYRSDPMTSFLFPVSGFPLSSPWRDVLAVPGRLRFLDDEANGKQETGDRKREMGNGEEATVQMKGDDIAARLVTLAMRVVSR